MLKCVENCGTKHRSKRVPWARCQEIFKFTLYIYIFSRNQTKKFTIEPQSYTAMPLYLFFDSLLSTCPKKMETESGPRLPALPYSATAFKEKFAKPLEMRENKSSVSDEFVLNKVYFV